MTNRPYHNPVVAEAIERAGGVSAAAAATGVGYQTAREWYLGQRRVPMRRCAALAQASGVSVEALRPDLTDAWRAIRQAA